VTSERSEPGDAELARRARAGDDAAMHDLVQRMRPMLRERCRHHFLAGADSDDLAQEALIGLYLAVRAFDADGGAGFRTFAELCVTRQLVSAVRAATRLKHGPLNDYVPLHAPAADGSERTLADMLPGPASWDPAEELVARERAARLRDQATQALSDLEVEVLRLHVAGVGYRDIAVRLRRHAKSVDNALQRIRRKLALHLVEAA
jgi:RNA polymerase sporulation-specific sigma factor